MRDRMFRVIGNINKKNYKSFCCSVNIGMISNYIRQHVIILRQNLIAFSAFCICYYYMYLYINFHLMQGLFFCEYYFSCTNCSFAADDSWNILNSAMVSPSFVDLISTYIFCQIVQSTLPIQRLSSCRTMHSMCFS